MYWRLVPSAASDATNTGTKWTELRQVIDGTITATSGLTSTAWQVGSCYTTGTAPTSGIYSASNSTATSGTATTWNALLTVTKKHYARNQVSGFDPSHKLRIDMGPWGTPARGLRPTYCDGPGSLLFPTNNITTRQGWSSDADVMVMGNYPYMNAGFTIHLIMNDSTFAFIFEDRQSSQTNHDQGTAILADFTFQSDIDPYHAGISSSIYPGCYIQGCVMDNLMEEPGTAAGADKAGFGVVRTKYVDTNNNVQQGAWNDEDSMHFGGSTSTGRRPTIYPLPRLVVRPTRNAANSVMHQLLPLTYVGQWNENITWGYYDPQQRPIRDIYRTSDNLNNGDRLKVGNNYYRIFRVHNTYGTEPTDATERAVYAFPENNVPY